MQSEKQDKTKKPGPESPPAFVWVILRRETFRNLLQARQFFDGIGENGQSVSDTVDELLVSFDLARLEASGGERHA